MKVTDVVSLPWAPSSAFLQRLFRGPALKRTPTQSRCYNRDEDAEAQRGLVTSPKSHTWDAAKFGLVPTLALSWVFDSGCIIKGICGDWKCPGRGISG